MRDVIEVKHCLWKSNEVRLIGGCVFNSNFVNIFLRAWTSVCSRHHLHLLFRPSFSFLWCLFKALLSWELSGNNSTSLISITLAGIKSIAEIKTGGVTEQLWRVVLLSIPCWHVSPDLREMAQGPCALMYLCYECLKAVVQKGSLKDLMCCDRTEQRGLPQAYLKADPVSGMSHQALAYNPSLS